MENFSFVLNLLVLAVNLLLMVSVGLSLEPRHFLALKQIKFRVLALLSAQTLLLPAIGLLVVSVLPLSAPVKAGLLLLAACPIGDIANFYVDRRFPGCGYLYDRDQRPAILWPKWHSA